jgi:predicted signal transduction protein with EAL and GGDEF domain
MISRSTTQTVSAGVATVVDGDDTKTFLTRADSALYAAKAAGRNAVYCHNGEDLYPAESQDITSTAAATVVEQPMRPEPTIAANAGS